MRLDQLSSTEIADVCNQLRAVRQTIEELGNKWGFDHIHPIGAVVGATIVSPPLGTWVSIGTSTIGTTSVTWYKRTA